MDTFAQNEINAQRSLASAIDIFKFPSSGLQIHLLILVYIHTYPVFARRINIVHLMRVKKYVPCRGNSLSEVST